MPPVLGLIKNPHYLYRMTSLVAITCLASYVSHDVLCSTMLPVIISSAKVSWRVMHSSLAMPSAYRACCQTHSMLPKEPYHDVPNAFTSLL